MDKRILRENDIRGKYPESLNEETIFKIGCALGTYIRRCNNKECVVGHDNRLSSQSLTNAFIDGLNSTGVNVIYLGTTTTPMLNYACIYLRKKFGAEVTASHNPKDENGIKMFEDYIHLIEKPLKTIYDILLKEDFITSEKGLIKFYNIDDIYTKMMLNSVTIFNKNLKVVVDAGNGTASVIQKSIFDNLGIEVIYINDISDGTFPNHHPDPSIEGNLNQLKEAVVKNKADLGIAFDGDADRLGMVDELGNYIETDIFPIIFMKDIMENSSYHKFLIDIKCSRLLSEEITRLGGEPIIVKNGSAFIEDELKRKHIICGAEYSGHIFFRDRFYGFDDGIYAGLRFLEIMSKHNKKCSELFIGLPKYYNTEEIRIKSPDEIKFSIIEKLKKYCDDQKYSYNTIDGVKVEFPDSWALVRCSNTGPTITMRFEATTKEKLESIKKEFTDLVNNLNK